MKTIPTKALLVVTLFAVSQELTPIGQFYDKHTEVITNPNFGTALIPEDELINSGAVWQHTFHIEDLFADPIPGSVRGATALTIQNCEVFGLEILEITRTSDIKLGSGYSRAQLAQLAREFCRKTKEATEEFNNQKKMLIAEIDDNMKSVRHLAHIKRELRDGLRSRAKRAPLEIIGAIGEKVFGIARKKTIKSIQKNLELLNKRQSVQYNSVLSDLESLHSVNLMHNEALDNISSELQEIQKDVVSVVQYLNESVRNTARLMQNIMTEAGLMYYIADARAQITTTTISLLNTLTLLRIKTGEMRNAMQKISAGILPNELVPVEKMVKTLHDIDQELMNKRSSFRLAISDTRYYYGMPISSYGYDGQIGIRIWIPLTTAGARFQNYRIQTIQLPVPLGERERNNATFSQITRFLPYFAISKTGQYYLELTEQDLSRCRGLDNLPKICTPVKFMFSIKTRPSCGLALYKGDSVMMKNYCYKEFICEKEDRSPQIYQIGSSSKLLITSVKGKFIKDCDEGTQFEEIQPCEMCITQPECGCRIKSDAGFLPAIGTDCVNKMAKNMSSVIEYPVNMMILAQVLNETMLKRYNGSVTFSKPPALELPKMDIRKPKVKNVVSLQESSFILDKVVGLAMKQEPIYSSAAAYLQEPQTLMEQIIQSDYAAPFQIVVLALNGIGVLIAVISYRKGCSAATTGAMTLVKMPGKVETSTFPPVKIEPTNSTPFVETLFTFWETIQIVIYLGILILIMKMLKHIIYKVYDYVTTGLYLTPFDGLTVSTHELTNVYLNVTDGQRSMYLFVYTLQVPETNIQLIQQMGCKIEFERMPKMCPGPTLAYSVPINNHNFYLSIRPIEIKVKCPLSMRFPNTIKVPVTKVGKFKTIVSNPYLVTVFVGNERYRQLVPIILSHSSSSELTEEAERKEDSKRLYPSKELKEVAETIV